MRQVRNLGLVAVAFLLLISLVARSRSGDDAIAPAGRGLSEAGAPCPPPAPCSSAAARICAPPVEATGRVLSFGVTDDISKIETHWADSVADLYLRHLRSLAANVHAYAPRYAREWRNMLWAFVQITGEARADVRCVGCAASRAITTVMHPGIAGAGI